MTLKGIFYLKKYLYDLFFGNQYASKCLDNNKANNQNIQREKFYPSV